jgi:hypothetical protein
MLPMLIMVERVRVTGLSKLPTSPARFLGVVAQTTSKDRNRNNADNRNNNIGFRLAQSARAA